MPIHDWSRVEPAQFHAFHHSWIEEIHRRLNTGGLPAGYYAAPEQSSGGYVADVLTLRTGGPTDGGGLAVAPTTRLTASADPVHRRRPSHVAVNHDSGDETVAVIELVSPGNKAGRDAFRAFVMKAADLVRQGVHLLVVDLFPPTRRDPNGMHAAIWKELTGKRFVPPEGMARTAVSYRALVPATAYIEPMAVGEEVPDMPLFISPARHISVPLAATYQSAWQVFPPPWRALLA